MSDEYSVTHLTTLSRLMSTLYSGLYLFKKINGLEKECEAGAAEEKQEEGEHGICRLNDEYQFLFKACATRRRCVMSDF